MFERIVAPLDGSKTAEMVLPYVTELASMFHSSIIVVRVSETANRQATVDCRSYLENIVGRLEEDLKRRHSIHTGVPIQIKLECLTGNTASEILNLASKIDRKLMVLSSHGVSGMGQWPLGNIAEKILRASNFPVLLIREAFGTSVVALEYIFRKILIPLDGSKLGEAAIPPAVSLAKATGAEIVLFQVLEQIHPFKDLRKELLLVHAYNEKLLAYSHDYLNKVKDSLINTISAVSVATGEGQVAEQIIDYSRANHVDLIAMSTNGRSGIDGWAFGSVTDKLLHFGNKPILVIRPKRPRARKVGK